MAHLEQQQQRNLNSCTAMASALVEELAKGNVKLVENERSLPDHWVIQGIALPDTEQNRAKIICASSLMFNAIEAQMGDIELQVGWKCDHGKIVCYIEPFDARSLGVHAAKAHITKLVKDIIQEIPAPMKPAGNDQTPDPQAYWMGPFPKRQLPNVEVLMEILLGFHGLTSLESRAFELRDGSAAIRCNRDEMQALLLKEKLAGDPHARLQ